MLRLKQAEGLQSLFRHRYANQWVGLLVLSTVIVFGVSVVEAGFLRQWLTPPGTINFILPSNGVAGIGVGSDVEVMGAHAGEIRRIKLNDSGRMYAVATLEPQFEPFIRSDSQAMIRKRFIVAGASYLDISRGRGQPLDWGFAVLQANVAPNPEDMIITTISDVQSRLVPAMDNLQSITISARSIMAGLQQGKGTVGALLTDDELFRRVNTLLASLNSAIETVRPLEKQLNSLVANANSVTGSMKKDVPSILSHADKATQQLPVLMIEAESTAASLRKLSNQLSHLWILGGGSKKRVETPILPPVNARP